MVSTFKIITLATSLEERVVDLEKDSAEAVHNAVVLEEVAKMARNAEILNANVQPAPDCIKDKHFYRKHGANAYYGQK